MSRDLKRVREVAWGCRGKNKAEEAAGAKAGSANAGHRCGWSRRKKGEDADKSEREVGIWATRSHCKSAGFYSVSIGRVLLDLEHPVC